MAYKALLLATAATLHAASLDTDIQARIQRFPATVSVYAKNLESGAVFNLHGDDAVRTASTIKLALMVEAFAQVAEGRAQWTEKQILKDSDKVSGSGVLHELSDGVWLPLRDLVNLMIVVSDNTATNLLIDRFTADAVNARMDKLGLTQTRLMRKVRGDGTQLKPAEGFSAAGREAANQKYGIGRSTPHEMVRLLEMLDHGEILSKSASSEMIEILKRQQFTEGIGRKLKLPTASKSGSLDALRSDVALVYSPRGKIAIAITVDGMKDIDYSVDNIGNLLIADLAQLIVKGL